MPKGESSLPVSSSLPPEFVPEALECYRAAVECLHQAQIPFAIAGAFVLHQHTGIWRNTKDLDIILEAKSIPAALTLLEEQGFRTKIEDPVWLAKAFRGEYFVDLLTALGNAALIVDQTWIDRAEPYRLFHISCRVMGAEELIASKIFVPRRERFDGADVAHLFRACASHLDWDRLRELMAGHAELLLWSLVFFAYIYPAHVDLIPRSIWNECIGALENHLDHPRPEEPFRGTLIDPNMFAIDVTEWGERDLYREYCSHHPFLLQAIQSKDGSRE